MRALVTGAFGFVGRHLCELLLRSGTEEVLALGTRAVPRIPGVTMLACNLLDLDLTRRVIAHHRPDVIYHLAAQSYVPQSVANPADTLVNNAGGQINLMEACRATDLDPIIVVASSSEVYGAIAADHLPAGEDAPFRPANPYAVSKITQDMLGLQYHLSYGMRIVRVRPFNHIGPGQSDRFVVSSFARQIAEIEAERVEPVLLVGNLEATRDFLDVRDVGRAYTLVARGDFAGEVFNVASGAGHRIRALVDTLLQLSSATIDVRQDPSRMRPSDAPIVVGDATKLRNSTGWRPAVTIKQSLEETLDYWRAMIRSEIRTKD
jgi:GDP-4-dehydro-6-deoxy-D-mannose reductase